MPKFVIEADDEKPLVVSVEKDDDVPGEINVKLDDWVVAIFRDGHLELLDAVGCSDEIDALLDGDGYIKVKKNGEKKFMK